jgi:hypothetical protein
MSTSNPHHLTWRKSSHSNGAGGECVEAAATGNAIALRDSKDPGTGAITVPFTAWRSLIKDIKSGNFDR